MTEKTDAEKRVAAEMPVAGAIHVRRVNMGDVSGQKIGLTQSSARDVRGDEVRMIQCATQSVQSPRVSATMSAALQVDADEARLKMCAVAVAEAERVAVEQSGVYAVIGQDVHVSRCGARTVLARERIQAEKSFFGVAAAREIDASEVRTGFLIAREVRGNVQAFFDTKAALAFGLAFGAAFAAVRLLRRR